MTDKKLDQQVEGVQADQAISEQKNVTQRDALGGSSLDDVSGGGWPCAATKPNTVIPTI